MRVILEPKATNQVFGKWGEDCAASYLEKKGAIIIARNVRTPAGEIDLIVLDREMVVFVEVKTRSTQVGVYPEEAITEEKLDHMIASAECYLDEHPEFPDNWRLDVIAITGKIGDKNPHIEWFENVS